MDSYLPCYPIAIQNSNDNANQCHRWPARTTHVTHLTLENQASSSTKTYNKMLNEEPMRSVSKTWLLFSMQRLDGAVFLLAKITEKAFNQFGLVTIALPIING